MQRPSGLRCEYSSEPLGVGAAAPRFSWIPPRGKRGSAQSAYRILCSRDKAALERGQGDAWDSGRREGADCNLVPWGGAPLAECSRYWWTVETWNGAESSRSEPARFDTAVFNPSTWKASWITMGETEFDTAAVLMVRKSINHNSFVPATLHHGIYLRRDFELAEAPARAVAHFCGLGYGELRVNGRKAGDARLDPGQTDYSERALYSSFDITDSLRAGANAFGIMLGNGRYIDAYGFGKPRAFLQVDLEYADGRREILISDESWRCSHGALRHNGIYTGEVYDARLEARGWDCPRFVAGSAWAPAALIDGPVLEPQEMPPIRATAELPARSMSNPAPGVFVFDFGQNFAGVVRLRARGQAGTAINLRFSELLNGEGMLHLGTNRESQSQDTFILAGEGLEVFEPRFTYHGFRYAEVSGYPGTPDIDAVRGIVLHTDLPRTGSFACSEPLANAIHSNVLWGQRSNLMSAPTDCPQRGERMGWLGDAQLASEEACCNFDMAGFYTKYLEDIRLAQKPDGSLSDVVPPYWPLYPADPAWSAAYPALAWAMYWNYGDARILERHYEGLTRYVDYLDAMAEGHILNALGSYGDWCPPGTVYPKKTPMAFTSTWYLCHDTLTVSRIAAVLAKKEDAARYRARAAEIAAAFNAKFLLGEGRYATLAMSPIDRSVGQTTQALPLFLGIVPEEQKAAAVERLLEAVVTGADSHIDAGIVGTRYLFEALRDAGHADVAWNVITQKSYPGWGYMIAEGATTLWERWEKLAGMGMNSHNHIMFGSVDAWFYRGAAGIIPLEPAWKSVLVAPKTVGGLAHAAATQATPRGPISVSWSRSPWLSGDGAKTPAADAAGRSAERGGRGGEFRLSVSIPDGTAARIVLPYADRARALAEGGRAVWSETAAAGGPAAASAPVPAAPALPEGLGCIERRGSVFEVEAGSGDYEFALSW